MQLYLDSASLDEVKAAHDLGILDGVTTNPTLIAKEKVDYAKRLAESGRYRAVVAAGLVSVAVLNTPAAGAAPASPMPTRATGRAMAAAAGAAGLNEMEASPADNASARTLNELVNEAAEHNAAQLRVLSGQPCTRITVLSPVRLWSS